MPTRWRDKRLGFMIPTRTMIEVVESVVSLHKYSDLHLNIHHIFLGLKKESLASFTFCSRSGPDIVS